MPADGFPEGHAAQAVRIVRVPLIQGLAHGLLDALGQVEIGLADLEVDDVDALCFQHARPLEDVHDQEGLDPLYAFCDHEGNSST